MTELTTWLIANGYQLQTRDGSTEVWENGTATITIKHQQADEIFCAEDLHNAIAKKIREHKAGSIPIRVQVEK